MLVLKLGMVVYGLSHLQLRIFGRCDILLESGIDKALYLEWSNGMPSLEGHFHSNKFLEVGEKFGMEPHFERVPNFSAVIITRSPTDNRFRYEFISSGSVIGADRVVS